VADVMCFYSKTGGFLPDRVSTLPEVVSLHLNVPTSRLSSFHVRSQLTKVRCSFSSQWFYMVYKSLLIGQAFKPIPYVF
ncbi:hypothetical protein GOODEAATRI_034299, partial [Goodea atripinnis]